MSILWCYNFAYGRRESFARKIDRAVVCLRYSAIGNRAAFVKSKIIAKTKERNFGMKIIKVKDYDEMSKVAAQIVAEEVQNNPECTLGLATGSTPIGMYDLLSSFCKQKKLSFKNVKTVNLDEYVGLGENDEQSYVYFMAKHLFDNVDVDRKNTRLPNGKATDLNAECEAYSRLVRSCPPDLQVLGIGSNGHIGFNEPQTDFASRTRVVNLTENTKKDNSRLFREGEHVPEQAITMGIAEIMQAKKILLLANGANKAKAVEAMLKGEISPACPASVLRLHPDCTVILDEQAASML